MSKHTPGPWSIQPVPHEDMIAVLQDGDGYESDDRSTWPNGGCDLAECFGPERKANARLIAAAPELLEFAEEVRRTGDTRLASMAIAVIAKAIGEAK